tara:strand:+ start:477 stop:938 length:462 start_codon:yes stop_codon:yes gene_type:complete
MQAFLPNALLEEVLREYLIIYWTDRHSNQADFPHPQFRTFGDRAFRSAELSEDHTNQIKDLLIEKYPENESVIRECMILLNKLHSGNFINNTSHSQYLISLTRNNVQWYDTFNQATVSLPYNEALEVNGMTLSMPQLDKTSFYYLDVFVPENA